MTLDCLGDELEVEPLEAPRMRLRLPTREKIEFDYEFEPAKKSPETSR